MVLVQKEVPYEWLCPPEGFNDNIDEDEELKLMVNGLNLIERLLSTIQSELILPQLSLIVQKLLASED